MVIVGKVKDKYLGIGVGCSKSYFTTSGGILWQQLFPAN
jgi:hypothetical protein